MTDEQPPVLNQPESEVVTIRRTDRVRRREAIVGWTQVAANVVVPVTIALAAWGLFQDQQRQRVNAADRQVELFYNESISDARVVLFDLWSGVDMRVLGEPRSRSFVDRFVEAVIESQPEQERSVRAAIVSIATYFDRVEACIERDRCDQGEILIQIGPYGRDFYCLYAGQLQSAREESLLLAVGQGLERFTERAGGCESGPS